MMRVTIRPLQGRASFVDSDPVAMPPAIEFVRYADVEP
jgi:hypothetical protein